MPIHTPVVKIKDGLTGKDIDSTLIGITESPNMLNVTKYGDWIGQSPGRTSYGSGDGIVQGFYHLKVGDTNRFMMNTTQRVYYRTSSGWSNVTGTVITSSIDDMVDYCTAYDGNLGTFYVVFVNHKGVWKFDGANACSALSAWSDYLPNLVRYYQGYLVCANVVYSGVRYGFRFRCSHTDNPNDTTGINSKTFNLTKDRNISDIVAIEHFGNYLTFYKTDCIYGVWLGSTKKIFEFDVWVHSIGLRAQRALAIDKDGGHFFLGYNDFYYWANRSNRPEGLASRKVRKRLFEDTDPDNLKRSWCEYDARYNQIRLYVPESYYPQTVYCLDLNDKKWSWWKEERTNVTAVGKYMRDTIVTIDELSGTIDGLTGTIDSLSGAATDNFPVILEGNNSGEVVYDSVSAYNNGSTAINSYYETGDYIFTNDEGVPFSYERILGVEVETKGRQSSGDRLYFDYSTDEGSTWTNVATGRDSDGTEWTSYMSLTTEWLFQRIYFDVKVKKIRFKLYNAQASSTWLVRKLKIITEESEWT